MQPYVIRQGDFLLSLAHQFGFDADTVWNDPKNAQLRQLRPNPNTLYPTDVLYIPEPNAPVMQSLTTGTTNNFVSSPPTTTLSVTFVGNDPTAYASKAYTIQELDQLTGLVTDGNGVAKFDAPVTLETATLVFTETGESYALSIGGMDPINTLSGIFLRLQNLGYIGAAVPFDASNVDLVRAALRALNASQASGSAGSTPASAPSSSDSTPASGPSSDPSPASAPSSSDPSPASAPSPSDSTPASGPSSDSLPLSGLSSDSSPGSAPSSSDPSPGSSPSSDPSPGSSPNGASDNAGLADDGTLDAPTSALLLKAHGS
jgi:N-acetylmuramoyl-L-alanine amidase